MRNVKRQGPSFRLGSLARQAITTCCFLVGLGSCGSELDPGQPYRAAELGQHRLALESAPRCSAERLLIEEPLQPLQRLLQDPSGGVSRAQACPDVAGYVGAPLGRSPNSVFCQYSARAGSTRPEQVLTDRDVNATLSRVRADVVAALGSAGLQPAEASQVAAGMTGQLDCPVVLPMAATAVAATRAPGSAGAAAAVEPGSPSPPATSEPKVIGPFSTDALSHLTDVVRNNIGWVAAPASLAPVTVAVIDTEGFAFDSPQAGVAKTHGRAVGQLIENLDCSSDDPPERAPLTPASLSPGCNLNIQNFQGLVVDPVSGEVHGRRSDLARAIHAALDAHLQQDQHARLIVNLSLGWPSAGAPRDSGADAVYWALQRAHCLGALVIAAAGNSSSDSDGGPLYPAAWEADAGLEPQSEACEALLSLWEPVSLPETGRAGAPLVYAVSAVDHSGRPLLNTRSVDGTTGLGGLARRAALGLAVLTEQGGSQDFTLLLTGSSMSTATVSALAARVWGQHDAFEGLAVLDQIESHLAPPVAPIAATLCSAGADHCQESYGIARWCQVLGEACPSGPTAPSLARLRRTLSGNAAPGRAEGDVVPQPGPITCSECTLQILPSSLRVDLRLASGVSADSLLLYDAASLKSVPPIPARTISVAGGTTSIPGVAAPVAAAVRLRSAAGTQSLEQLLIARP